MFVSSALAADASSGINAMSPLASSAFPMIMVIVIMYLLIIRPNQKKLKNHQEMVAALKKGDKVVTSGGIIGVVNKIENDGIVLLEVSEEVRIKVMRESISSVLTKMPIANDNKKDDKFVDKLKNK